MASRNRLLGYVVLGHLYITVPALALLLGLPALAYFSVRELGWAWTLAAGAAAVVAGLWAAWRWWGWTVTLWRIRSFGALDEIDWLRLERLAERAYLIWPQGHPAEELEIRSGDQDRRIREVLERAADLRTLEKLYFGFEAPRKYGFHLRRRDLLVSLGGRILVTAVSVTACMLLPQPYLGLLLLVVVFYPSRDFRMYRHLGFRGAAIELSDAGVVRRVPELSVCYWHNYRAYRLYEHEHLLVLEGEAGEEDAIDLTYYRISDYRKFASLIEVYIERYGEKVAHSVYN